MRRRVLATHFYRHQVLFSQCEGHYSEYSSCTKIACHRRLAHRTASSCCLFTCLSQPVPQAAGARESHTCAIQGEFCLLTDWGLMERRCSAKVRFSAGKSLQNRTCLRHCAC